MGVPNPRDTTSLYGYANLKDEQKKVLKSYVEGKDVFVLLPIGKSCFLTLFSIAPFNSLACFRGQIAFLFL